MSILYRFDIIYLPWKLASMVLETNWTKIYHYLPQRYINNICSYGYFLEEHLYKLQDLHCPLPFKLNGI